MSEETAKTIRAWSDLGAVPLMGLILGGLVWVQWKDNEKTQEIIQSHASRQSEILMGQSSQFGDIDEAIQECVIALGKIEEALKRNAMLEQQRMLQPQTREIRIEP